MWKGSYTTLLLCDIHHVQRRFGWDWNKYFILNQNPGSLGQKGQLGSSRSLLVFPNTRTVKPTAPYLCQYQLYLYWRQNKMYSMNRISQVIATITSFPSTNVQETKHIKLHETLALTCVLCLLLFWSHTASCYCCCCYPAPVCLGVCHPKPAWSATKWQPVSILDSTTITLTPGSCPDLSKLIQQIC